MFTKRPIISSVDFHDQHAEYFVFVQAESTGDSIHHPRETTNMKTQTVASYFRVRPLKTIMIRTNKMVTLVFTILLFSLYFAVFSNGPVIKDGGRPASLCALHKTQ